MYQHNYAAAGMIGGAISGGAGAALCCSDSSQKSVGTPRDRGILETVSDGLANSIGELAGMLDVLEQRLSPVLPPEAPTPAANGVAGAPAIPTSPAIGYLVNQRHRIEYLQTRIGSLMSRLDT